MKNIVFIGMMGSGKTAIGRSLAEKMRRRFLDSDTLVVERAGKSIPEIFSHDGEQAFRALESAVMRDILYDNTDAVISTGGGVVLDGAVRDLIAEKSVCIWLDASPETLWRRVKNDTDRPLLQKPDPLSVIRTLLQDRTELYKSLADMIVEVSHDDVGVYVHEIQENLSQYS